VNAKADNTLQATFDDGQCGLGTALVRALRGQAFIQKQYNRAFNELQPETQKAVEKRMAMIAMEENVHAIAAENKLRELATLISSGCNLDIRDLNGFTPLMIAARRDHTDACVLLLQGGADPSLEFLDGARVRRAIEMAKSNTTLALLKALAGDSDFDMPSLDKAILQLQADMQEIAERMIDSIAEKQATTRKTQELRKRQQEGEERKAKAVNAAELMARFQVGDRVRLSTKGRKVPLGFDWVGREILGCRVIRGTAVVFVKGPEGRTVTYDAVNLEVVR